MKMGVLENRTFRGVLREQVFDFQINLTYYGLEHLPPASACHSVNNYIICALFVMLLLVKLYDGGFVILAPNLAALLK